MEAMTAAVINVDVEKQSRQRGRRDGVRKFYQQATVEAVKLHCAPRLDFFVGGFRCSGADWKLRYRFLFGRCHRNCAVRYRPDAHP